MIKIYITNIVYALSLSVPDTGNLRETFFFNQIRTNYLVRYPDKGDFLVDDKYFFEIRGKNKTAKQIAQKENAWIATDGIEVSAGRKIPLWLFGFLY